MNDILLIFLMSKILLRAAHSLVLFLFIKPIEVRFLW